MFITPATLITKLISTFQVLITLDMVLSTTMALPVTSKPIESTVENLAWQAWIELPPEQKQQVKSRKVTPKSIFTLPLRVECPDGHKQVDTKCIPIAIGTNDVLIDLNALGLLVGSTQPEDLYDYDDLGEEMANPMPFGSEMSVVETDKTGEGLTVEFKPPSKDEPLKFNIFANKFNIFHEESLEDYSSVSNEGVQSSEKQQNLTATNESSTAATNVTAINDLFSEASNISENNFEFNVQPEKDSSTSNSHVEESHNFTTLADDVDFEIDAISVPAFSFETTKQNNLSLKENESAIELVTTIMDTEATTTIEDQDKTPENDIKTLLQTESFLPLLNQTTATTLQDSAFTGNFSLKTVDLQESSDSSSDSLNRNVNEEMTTLPIAMDQDIELKTKQEFTRSVNLHPTIRQNSDIADDDGVDSGDNEQAKDSTLESLANDEPVETTTPIQLDETTIIETHSSLSTTPSTAQEELKELLLQQEQAQKYFEELQRMRKGQKDQHVVLKKSKVQPVEVLPTTTELTTKTTTAASTAINLQTATKQVDELIASTAAATTVTPLLTVHNENDNNDRFYYQHFGKQDNVATQRSDNELKQKTVTAEVVAGAEEGTGVATTTKEVKTIPLTREINLAEELRIINELVKGIRTTTTTFTTMQTTTSTTTEKPTAYTSKTILTNDIQSMSSFNSHSESSSMATKPTHTTSLIWSKIMPLLTTSSTTPLPTSATEENFNKITEKELSEPASSSSARSNRNSKIIRFNNFNTNSAAKTIPRDSSKAAAAKTIFQDSTPSVEDTSSSSTTSSNQLTSSTEEVSAYEPYWWIPVAWRVNTPTSSERQQEEQEDTNEEQPLLLRLWSAYAPKSS